MDYREEYHRLVRGIDDRIEAIKKIIAELETEKEKMIKMLLDAEERYIESDDNNLKVISFKSK